MCFGLFRALKRGARSAGAPVSLTPPDAPELAGRFTDCEKLVRFWSDA